MHKINTSGTIMAANDKLVKFENEKSFIKEEHKRNRNNK